MVDLNKLSVYSSANREDLPIYPKDVYHVSEKGRAEINAAATSLDAEHLELLVLIDDRSSFGDIEQKLPHIAPEAVRDIARSLLRDGLIREPTVEEETGIDLNWFFAEHAQAEPSEGTKASADREAAKGVPALEEHGYYVSIARRPVTGRKLAEGHKPSVLLIDDDPEFCALVEKLLGTDGFVTRVASTRDQIVAELRKVSLPDLVLLDVTLPGTNGFDILNKMKQVPALKALPVIMTTAEATREGVMRGLIGGADGYLTKPLKGENLLKGARTVLGLV